MPIVRPTSPPVEEEDERGVGVAGELAMAHVSSSKGSRAADEAAMGGRYVQASRLVAEVGHDRLGALIGSPPPLVVCEYVVAMP